MTNSDPDMAMKTALAEAIKKAGHQLGIALYLWDETARERAEQRRALAKATDSEATLKRAVFKLAQERLDRKPESAAEVASVFGVDVQAVTEKEGLLSILRAEGVL